MAPSPQTAPSPYEMSQSENAPSFRKTPVAVLVVICLCVALAVLLVSYFCWRARRKEIAELKASGPEYTSREPELESVSVLSGAGASNTSSRVKAREKVRAWMKSGERPQISYPRPLSSGGREKEREKEKEDLEDGTELSLTDVRRKSRRGESARGSGSVVDWNDSPRIGYAYGAGSHPSSPPMSGTGPRASKRYSSSSSHRKHYSRQNERPQYERRRLDSITDKEDVSYSVSSCSTDHHNQRRHRSLSQSRSQHARNDSYTPTQSPVQSQPPSSYPTPSRTDFGHDLATAYEIENGSTMHLATMRNNARVPRIRAAPVSVPVRLAMSSVSIPAPIASPPPVYVPGEGGAKYEAWREREKGKEKMERDMPDLPKDSDGYDAETEVEIELVGNSEARLASPAPEYEARTMPVMTMSQSMGDEVELPLPRFPSSVPASPTWSISSANAATGTSAPPVPPVPPMPSPRALEGGRAL